MTHAERAIRFIENLTHVKNEWAGKPFKLMPWQREFINKLFAPGIRNGFLFIPRKNGKTDLMAALLVYILYTRQGIEIYSASNDRAQASITFDRAAAMIRADGTLKKLCRILDSQKTIKHRNGSFYKALSSEAYTKHGYSPTVVVVDEYHESETSELFDVLKSGMGASQLPLMLVTTTAGATVEHSPCYQLYQYAKRVAADPSIDPSFLPVIYECPDDKWEDENNWRTANPSLGTTVTLEFLREEYNRAKELPSEQAKFKRLYLNLWSDSDIAWLPVEHWQACGSLPVDAQALKGQECWAGLDCAATTDTTALALMFPQGEGWAGLFHFWLPKAGIHAREDRDKVPYQLWADQGYLTLTEGNVTDQASIRAKINELAGIYQITEIAVDRALATQLIVQLNDDMPGRVIPFGQGFLSMGNPARELEKLVISHAMAHGNNPVLNWMARNAVAEIDAAGNVKPTKAKSRGRIDGVVAMLMALGRGMIRKQATPEFTGLLTI